MLCYLNKSDGNVKYTKKYSDGTSRTTLPVGGVAQWLAAFVALTKLTHDGPG